MSRKILETCLARVENKFELVLLASVRARKIAARGKAVSLRVAAEQAPQLKPGMRVATHSFSAIEGHANKAPVMALREIASGVVNMSELRSECEQDAVRKDSLIDANARTKRNVTDMVEKAVQEQNSEKKAADALFNENVESDAAAVEGEAATASEESEVSNLSK
ncbi:MAG: DNA-directed RNA polymerase subunit omega [Alphaproteobacteria bacterium]|nr:DNA-directed RNA polymerase subunit omega [Alphaproteobacteria bacterium]